MVRKNLQTNQLQMSSVLDRTHLCYVFQTIPVSFKGMVVRTKPDQVVEDSNWLFYRNDYDTEV